MNDAPTQKWCTGCGVVKPLMEFHRWKRGVGGRHPRCRECRNAAARGWWTARYSHDPAGEKLRTMTRKHADPEKRRARDRLYAAIKAGRLTRGDCFLCGRPKAEAHHADYSRPFDVTWLCPAHHRQLHNGRLICDPPQ